MLLLLLSVFGKAGRQRDTHNREIAELSWKHALSSQADEKVPSTVAQAAFLPGEPGNDSHPLALDVPLCTISVLSKAETQVHISPEKLSMGDSCRIFQEIP